LFSHRWTQRTKEIGRIKLKNQRELVKQYKDGIIIVGPKITRKERLYLDSEMPCDAEWLPNDFELSKEEIAAYRAIYRYYPAYTEMLL